MPWVVDGGGLLLPNRVESPGSCSIFSDTIQASGRGPALQPGEGGSLGFPLDIYSQSCEWDDSLFGVCVEGVFSWCISKNSSEQQANRMCVCVYTHI